MSRTNLMESIQHNLKESDSLDRFSKGIQTMIADNGYECEPRYDEGMAHFTVGYNGYHLHIGIYAADEPTTQYGVDTICIGGDTDEETLYPKVVAGWDYDDAAPGVNKNIKVGDEVYVIYNDINKTSIDEVSNIINDIFDPVLHGNKEDESTELHEDEATSSKEESFLNKTITVYDIDSFLKDEEQVVSFHYNSGAAILFKEGSDEGCIVDYEAIGEKFTSKDEEVEIEANDIPNDEPGKISIHVMPQYICRTTISEIISKAPHKEMKASEFFTKHNYNMRCSTNFSNMLDYLGVKVEESNLKEEDDEWNTYNVAVGFCGFIGVEQEYNISARSKQEAVCEALDNPGSEAEQDLSADVVDDHGDGSYTVTVSFAGNVGAENDYEVTAESAEEAEMLALEDAKSDLEIISVDGKEYTYGDEVESAGMVNEEGYFKNKDIERREGTGDKEPPKSTVSYYIIGEKDFQKLLKLNGGAFDSGYLVISTAEANELANKQDLIANDSGIFSKK